MKYELIINLKLPTLYKFELYVEKKFLFFSYWSHVITKYGPTQDKWNIAKLIEFHNICIAEQNWYKEKQKEFPKTIQEGF